MGTNPPAAVKDRSGAYVAQKDRFTRRNEKTCSRSPVPLRIGKPKLKISADRMDEI